MGRQRAQLWRLWSGCCERFVLWEPGGDGIPVDEAFSRLRGYARRDQLLLVDVARDVVSGAVGPDAVVCGSVRKVPARGKL